THDLFVLAPRVAPDGDRDGLPNVVVEALSQGLPVIATRVAAVGEAVDDRVNGRLVAPEDAAALAAAVDELAAEPAGRPPPRPRVGGSACGGGGGGGASGAGATGLLGLFPAGLDEPAAVAAPAGVGR